MLWRLKPKASDEFIRRFPEYEPTVLHLLYQRGLRTQQQIDEFFNPDFEGDLHDPFLMLGMKEAVKRVFYAVKKQEKVAIFGDYDCDGVCSVVILKAALEKLGANLSGGVHIPDRKLEGYGLNIPVIKKLASQKVDLILTVDCGISDIEEIKLAKLLGMDVIVFDHHRVGSKIPSAKVIVDPWQPKDNYPFKELAAAGVVFKLVQALISADKLQVKSGKLTKGWEKWLLDLVSLATVADCVPLLGENRTLVRYGLIVLAQTKRIGLQELMKIARLNPIFEIETLTTNLDAYSLGFILAPRLNAAGRMDHASLAYELLISQERDKARFLAEKINEHNRQRQKLTDQIVAEVESRIKEYLGDKNHPVIVEADKSWSPGVIGLVAGKIKDRYQRPTFIFKEEDGFNRGSARSVTTFNIIEAITQCAGLLKEFGGHAASAGLVLENKNFKAFVKKINEVARQKLADEDLIPKIEIDLELDWIKVTWELFDEQERFGPFGNSNGQPVYLVKNLEIKKLYLVGNGSKHLKLELASVQPQNKIFRAIGFNFGKNWGSDLKIGDKVDVVFELIADEWNGTRNLQFKIVDLQKTETTNIKKYQ